MNRNRNLTVIMLNIFTTWNTSEGSIFTKMQTKFEVPWKDYISGDILDLEYFGNRSGTKNVSKLVQRLLTSDGLSDESLDKLVDLIWYKNKTRWIGLWDTMFYEYNPIENYNKTETITTTYGHTVETTTSNERDTTHPTMTTTNTGSDTFTKDGTETTTNTKTGEETESTDRTGTETTTNTRTGNETESTAKTGTEKNTNIKTGNSVDDNIKSGTTKETTENTISAFNSSSYSNNNKQTVTAVNSADGTTTEDKTTTTYNNVQDENTLSFTDRSDNTTKTYNDVQDENVLEFDDRNDTTTITYNDVQDENILEFNNRTDTTTYNTTNETSYDGDDKVEESGNSKEEHSGDDTVVNKTVGNIGVTTSQQMIQSQRDLFDWKFFDTVFKDVDEILTLGTYGTEDASDLTEIKLRIPVASLTEAGIVKTSAEINSDTFDLPIAIDSNGKLWAKHVTGSGTGGAVDSVNGKTGVVVLNYDDIGSPSLEEFQDVESDCEENSTDISLLKTSVKSITDKYVTSVNGQTGDVTVEGGSGGSGTSYYGDGIYMPSENYKNWTKQTIPTTTLEEGAYNTISIHPSTGKYIKEIFIPKISFDNNGVSNNIAIGMNSTDSSTLYKITIQIGSTYYPGELYNLHIIITNDGTYERLFCICVPCNFGSTITNKVIYTYSRRYTGHLYNLYIYQVVTTSGSGATLTIDSFDAYVKEVDSL